MSTPARGLWISAGLWRCGCQPHPQIHRELAQAYVHTINEVHCRHCQALRPRMCDQPAEGREK